MHSLWQYSLCTQRDCAIHLFRVTAELQGRQIPPCQGERPATAGNNNRAMTNSVTRDSNAEGELQIWGGLECTINRVGDRWMNQADRSGHDVRGVSDLQLFDS